MASTRRRGAFWLPLTDRSALLTNRCNAGVGAVQRHSTRFDACAIQQWLLCAIQRVNGNDWRGVTDIPASFVPGVICCFFATSAVIAGAHCNALLCARVGARKRARRGKTRAMLPLPTPAPRAHATPRSRAARAALSRSLSLSRGRGSPSAPLRGSCPRRPRPPRGSPVAKRARVEPAERLLLRVVAAPATLGYALCRRRRWRRGRRSAPARPPAAARRPPRPRAP